MSQSSLKWKGSSTVQVWDRNVIGRSQSSLKWKGSSTYNLHGGEEQELSQSSLKWKGSSTIGPDHPFFFYCRSPRSNGKAHQLKEAKKADADAVAVLAQMERLINHLRK